MGFIFLQLRILYGQSNSINAQTGVQVSGIQLDFIDDQPEFSDHGNEVLEIRSAFQLQMDLKVIGTVFQIGFKLRKQSKTGEKKNKQQDTGCIKTCADTQADDTAAPERSSGSQPADLILGTE